MLTKPLPSYWQWPVEGKIHQAFDIRKYQNKGLNILTGKSKPVRASANGIVIYEGFHISDYGGLIILKHNNNFLTAYAHNKQIIVSEGEKVLSGQIIGKTGTNSQGINMSHFEIRKDGKALDPLKLLKKYN